MVSFPRRSGPLDRLRSLLPVDPGTAGRGEGQGWFGATRPAACKRDDSHSPLFVHCRMENETADRRGCRACWRRVRVTPTTRQQNRKQRHAGRPLWQRRHLPAGLKSRAVRPSHAGRRPACSVAAHGTVSSSSPSREKTC